MEIRGERECLDCGSTWSYFDTKSVESVGGEEMDSDSVLGELRMDDVIPRLGTEFEDALEDAEENCRSYVSRQGFIKGGELQPPSPRFVMACEIIEIADALLRPMRREITEDERLYVVDMIHGLKEGEPPAPDERPESLDTYHNLAVARTVEDYAREVSRYVRNSSEKELPGEIEEARTKAKRTKATEGEEDDAVEGLRLLRDVYEEIEKA
ncbi:MAG: hypothetical protein SXQ77_08310 [Halobacteria archaeon]|nr:hypothetical protein [Halobacteria archaeon]